MNRFVKIIGALLLCIAALIFNIKGEIRVQSQSDVSAQDKSFLYESQSSAELLDFTNSFTNFIQPSNYVPFTPTIRLLKTKLLTSFYQFSQVGNISNYVIQYDVKESKSILSLQSNDYYVYLLRRIII